MKVCRERGRQRALTHVQWNGVRLWFDGQYNRLALA